MQAGCSFDSIAAEHQSGPLESSVLGPPLFLGSAPAGHAADNTQLDSDCIVRIVGVGTEPSSLRRLP